MPPSLGAVLVFTDGAEAGRQFPLVFMRTVLGRTKGDILIRDLSVSSKHVAIDYRRGKFHVVDLESRNGVFLGEEKVRDHHVFIDQPVRVGDSLFHIELDVDKAEMLRQQQTHMGAPQRGLKQLLRDEFFRASADQTKITSTKPATGKPKFMKVRVELPNGKSIKLKYVKAKIYVGREDAELVLQDIEVSRRHAMFERLDNNQVIIQDLASANGTHVNDKRIERAVLKKGDRVKMGQTIIEFMGVFQ
jgi:pSer/pThr/pTyr-binding forkhead associated (FHA) protein